MSILKCKYCGGTVSPFPGNPVGVCSTCGSTMTLPEGEDPRRSAAHNAGNYFRRMGDFDKALSIYRQLLEQDPLDAEASWGSALSKFGIVYEEDPEMGGYAPVCRAPIPGSFLCDGDYLAALAHSAGAARLQYEREAARIEALLALPVEETELAWEEEPVPQPAEVPCETEADPSELIKKAFLNLEKGNWAEAEACCQQSIQLDGKNPLSYLGSLMAQLQCRKPRDLMNADVNLEGLESYQKAVEYADPDLKKTLTQCCTQVNKRMQLAKIRDFYENAVTQMEIATTQEDFQQAAQQFARLSHYQDSDDRRLQCLQRGEEARKDAIYQSAMTMAKSAKTKAQWEEIQGLFASISGWRDADQKVRNCQQQCKQAKASRGILSAAGKGLRIVAGLTGAAVLLGAGIYLFVTKYYIPQGKYDQAENFLAMNDRENAIVAFQELGTYKDSQERAAQIQADWYQEAQILQASSEIRRAAIAFGSLGDYSDSRDRSRELWMDIAPVQSLCAGGWFTAGLRFDGMAYAVGDNRDKQCEVGGWLNIRSVSAGWSHTVGLRTDGTVVAAGFNGDGRGDVDQWRNIVEVSAGQWHTVGLKSDGKVIGTGCAEDGRIDFRNWQDVVSVSAGRNHTLGLRVDNTVMATGRNDYGQCNIADWYGIRAIAAGGEHSVGLKMDGTVVATGCDDDGQCQVGDWKEITSIAAGYYHTVGLKSDGTVVAVGLDWDMQCQVQGWTDIVAIAAGGWHTVGLKSDGTVVCAGRNEHGQCDTMEWANMMLPA